MGVYKRGKVWWIRYAGSDGKIRFESAGRTKHDADTLLHQRKSTVSEGKGPLPVKRIGNHTFRELVDQYLPWAQRDKDFEHKRDRGRRLVLEFGGLPLRAFTTFTVEAWQTRLLETHKPATVNRYLALLKHMFTKSV